MATQILVYFDALRVCDFGGSAEPGARPGPGERGGPGGPGARAAAGAATAGVHAEGLEEGVRELQRQLRPAAVIQAPRGPGHGARARLLEQAEGEGPRRAKKRSKRPRRGPSSSSSSMSDGLPFHWQRRPERESYQGPGDLAHGSLVRRRPQRDHPRRGNPGGARRRRTAHELQTLVRACDHLGSGQPPEVANLLARRFKAIEQSLRDGYVLELRRSSRWAPASASHPRLPVSSTRLRARTSYEPSWTRPGAGSAKARGRGRRRRGAPRRRLLFFPRRRATAAPLPSSSGGTPRAGRGGTGRA